VAIPLVKDGARQYFCVRTIIQVHDATIHSVLAKRYEGADYEIVRLWEQFRETEWFELLRQQEKAERHMRVLPLPGTAKTELLPEEDLERILREAQQVAVVPCPCRVNRVREGECDKPVDVCVSLTPGAVRYIEESGTGRVLTKEETSALLDQVRESGLIPTTGGTDKIPQLCFCCTDCCIELRAVARYGYHLAEKSRFEAEADLETCTGCQTCVERCPFDAIEMRRYPSSKRWLAHVDPGKCYGCGVCVVKCPSEALSLKEVRPPDYIHHPHAYIAADV